MLDTSRSYETPESIGLEMRIAGPVVRARTWAIDMAIRAGLYLVISLVFAFFGGFGMAVILIGLFLVEWFYPVFLSCNQVPHPGRRRWASWWFMMTEPRYHGPRH